MTLNFIPNSIASKLSRRQRLGLISVVVLLLGIGLFAAIARFGHIDFNNYQELDCFVDTVTVRNGGQTVLHYYFWQDGVERIYQDQQISAAEGKNYQKGDEFQCLFYGDEKNFITKSQFYEQFWLMVGSVALTAVGFVMVISTALGSERRFE